MVTPERALEVSLAENSGREPMDPADEFEAFKTLIEEGKGVEDVAARFGVSPLIVQRRLKLVTRMESLTWHHRWLAASSTRRGSARASRSGWRHIGLWRCR
jgi:hypothetical protein